MTLDHWKLLITACECSSFTKCGQSLNISVTSIIQQINLIEKELGFRIFDRSNHGIALTEQGRKYCAGIKTILDEYDTLLVSVKTLSAESIPDVKLQILEAYIHLCERKSFRQVSVLDICSEAGVSRKTFYNYFLDKEDLTAWSYMRHFEGQPNPFYDYESYCTKTIQILTGHSLFYEKCFQYSNLAMVITAMYHRSIDFNPLPMNNQECWIVGSGPYDSSTINEVIDMLAAKNTGIEKIITGRYKIDNINDAFRNARKDPHSIKMIIDYRL